MLPPYTINFPSSLNSTYWLEMLSRTRGYGVCPMFSFPCGLFPVISGLFQFPGWYPQLYILVSICLFRDYSISVNLFLVHQKHPCQEPLFTEKVYERSLLYMNIIWLHTFTYGNTFDLEDFFLPSHPFLLWSPVRPGARKQPRLPKNTHHWDVFFYWFFSPNAVTCDGLPNARHRAKDFACTLSNPHCSAGKQKPNLKQFCREEN